MYVRKEKKGFTLIEVLAVVVILSIILSIAVPRILVSLENARKRVFLSSATSIVNAVKMEYSQNLYLKNFDYKLYEFDKLESSGYKKGSETLKLKGDLPSAGATKLKENGQIALAVISNDEKYCAKKSYNDSEITIENYVLGNCNIETDGEEIGEELYLNIVASPLEWSRSKEVTISHNAGNRAKLQYQLDATTGEWIDYIKPFELTRNTTIYARLYSRTNSIQSSLIVTKIDREAPEIVKSREEVTTKNIKVYFNVTDTQSGVDKSSITCEYGDNYTEKGIVNENTCIMENLKNNTSYSYRISAQDNLQNKNSKIFSTTTGDFSSILVAESNPGKWEKSKTITITGDTKLQYQLDTTTGEWTDYTKPFKITKNSTIYARSTDGINTSATASFIVTKIDRTPPTCGSFGGQNTVWSTASRTITISCSDSQSGCTSNVYNAKAFTSGTVKTSNVSYTISDNAGNTSVCTGNVNVYMDKEGPSQPQISLVYGSGGNFYGNLSSGAWTAYDVLTDVNSSDSGSGIAYYQYSHDNYGWSNDISKLGWSYAYYNGKNKLQYWITWAGRWNFYVRAVDNLGNVSASSNVFTFGIDRTPPSVSFGTNGSGGWSKSSGSSVTATESGSGLAELRGRWMQGTTGLSSRSDFTGAGGWSIGNGGMSQANPSDGEWYLWIYAKDNAGNETITHTNAFLVDNTPPTIIMEPGDGKYYKGFVASVACSDSGSGMPGDGTKFYDWDTLTTGQYYTQQKLASTGVRVPGQPTQAYGECRDNVGNSVRVYRNWNVVKKGSAGSSGATTPSNPRCSCEGGCQNCPLNDAASSCRSSCHLN